MGLKFYFSGTPDFKILPEVMLKRPNVMVTYFDFQSEKGSKTDLAFMRLKNYEKRKIK